MLGPQLCFLSACEGFFEGLRLMGSPSQGRTSFAGKVPFPEVEDPDLWNDLREPPNELFFPVEG